MTKAQYLVCEQNPYLLYQPVFVNYLSSNPGMGNFNANSFTCFLRSSICPVIFGSDTIASLKSFIESPKVKKHTKIKHATEWHTHMIQAGPQLHWGCWGCGTPMAKSQSANQVKVTFSRQIEKNLLSDRRAVVYDNKKPRPQFGKCRACTPLA